MEIIDYKNKKPIICKSVFIASGAKIIGDVEILDYSSVWYNCVLRGDVNYIRIGKNTNIQDGTIIHVSSQGFSATGDKGAPTIIGNNVTIGHNATIHACEVKNFSLIGMGAVAAGALIPPGTVIGEKELWAGNPAKFIRKISSKEEDLLKNTPKVYSNLSKEFLKK